MLSKERNWEIMYFSLEWTATLSPHPTVLGCISNHLPKRQASSLCGYTTNRVGHLGRRIKRKHEGYQQVVKIGVTSTGAVNHLEDVIMKSSFQAPEEWHEPDYNYAQRASSASRTHFPQQLKMGEILPIIKVRRAWLYFCSRGFSHSWDPTIPISI